MGGDSIWLQAQDFPGNLRELRQVVTRAAAQSNNGAVSRALLELHSRILPAPVPAPVPAHRPSAAANVVAPAAGASGLAGDRRTMRLSASMVAEALLCHRGHRGNAALSLGVTERPLYRGIERERSGLPSTQRPSGHS